MWTVTAAMAFSPPGEGPPSEEQPHDVLAAEEFPLGAADPLLHHRGPLRLPPDPTGLDQPHDVLAAEEFPLPAPSARHPAPSADRTLRSAECSVPARRLARTVVPGLTGLAVVALLVRRALGRRTLGPRTPGRRALGGRTLGPRIPGR